MPEFERAGVTLAIENHDRFTTATLIEILRDVGSPRLGICFDTANSIGCLESAEHVLDVLGPYGVNLHIKDFQIMRPPRNLGFIVEDRPAGQGRLDLLTLLRRVRDFDHDMNAIVELWPPLESTVKVAAEMEDRESVEYLRGLIAK